MNEKINQIFIRFKKSGLNQLQKIQVSLMSKSENFQLLDPRLQFNRGFSITTNERREIILSPSQIELDDIINVKVAHGSITAKVIEKREENV
jgi:exonuclease VII large subunit